MTVRLLVFSSAAILWGGAAAAQEAPPFDALLAGPPGAEGFPISSLAEARPAAPASLSAAAPGDLTTPATLDPTALDSTALDSTALGALHARQGVTATAMSSQLLQATNSGNSVRADRIRTGDIFITTNAFAGFGGVGNFVMNTGANNNLQGAVTINIVTTTPAP